MTNIDSILKTDVTLPMRVHRVKAIVFPVVMYGFGTDVPILWPPDA